MQRYESKFTIIGNLFPMCETKFTIVGLLFIPKLSVSNSDRAIKK